MSCLGSQCAGCVGTKRIFFLKIGFIALKCANVYMKFFIKTVLDTSLHEASDLT